VGYGGLWVLPLQSPMPVLDNAERVHACTPVSTCGVDDQNHLENDPDVVTQSAVYGAYTYTVTVFMVNAELLLT